jgi:hypothetical protein
MWRQGLGRGLVSEQRREGRGLGKRRRRRRRDRQRRRQHEMPKKDERPNMCKSP